MKQVIAMDDGGLFSTHSNHVWSRRLLALILVVFTGLCIWYNATLPLYEAFDEPAHYVHINWIADHKTLPNLNIELPSYESYQPPLYYIATALVILPFDRSDFKEVYRFNPVRPINLTGDYLTSGTNFPPQGSALSSRVARLFSTVLGLGVLWLIYKTAQLVAWREADLHTVIPLLATAVMAFNPKFVRMSSTITNDIGLAIIGALHLYLALRMMTQATPPSLRSMLALGATVGLALATKYNGMVLAPSAGFVLLWCWVKHHAPNLHLAPHAIRRGLAYGASAGLGFALTAGVYFAYNLSRYEDVLGWKQANRINDTTLRAQTLTLAGLINVSPYTLSTYWGGTGFEFRFPPEANTVLLLLLGLTCIGAAAGVLRRGLPQEASVLFVAALGVTAANVWWTAKYIYPNLRYMSVAYTPFAIGIAFGSVAWLGLRWRRQAALLVGLGHLLVSLAVPPLIITPDYAGPRYLSAQDAANVPTDGRITFENGIELVHVSLDKTRWNLNEPIRLTAVWLATQQIEKSYLMTMDVFDPQDRWLGRFSSADSFERKHAPATWRPGELLTIDYQIPVSYTQQTLGRIFVGWYEVGPKSKTTQLVRIKGQNTVSAPIGQVKLRGVAPPEQKPPQAFSAMLGKEIGLEGYALTNDTLTLFWRAHAEPNRNYTIFIHGLDAQGQMSMQQDQPLQYPALFWDKGEQVVETYTVPGIGKANQIQIGLYLPETGEHLQAQKPAGGDWPDNIISLKEQP